MVASGSREIEDRLVDAHGLPSLAVRVGLPVGIVLGGLAVASRFPRSEPAGLSATDSRDAVVYRRQAEPPDAEPVTPGTEAARVEARVPGPNPFVPGRPAAVLRPVEAREPPPSLGKTFPRDDSWPSSRWGISMGIGVPGAGPSGVRIHKIADGDTLAGLAERYLGDAGRAGEIYRANRDVLASPEALPIGRELKIPAAHDELTASP